MVQAITGNRHVTNRQSTNYVSNLDSNKNAAVQYDVTRFHPRQDIDENWKSLGIKSGSSKEYRMLGYRIKPRTNAYMW